MSKIVFQLDRLGFLIGETDADESPLEPGVFHIPAGCVEAGPPAEVPDGKWPRWTGSQWVLANAPRRAEPESDDPVAKLRAFLINNPDVAALLPSNDGGANV